LSRPNLRALEGTVASLELNQARNEYEIEMNRILFNANILSKANVLGILELKLPIVALPMSSKAPKCGLIAVPAHNMKGKINHMITNSFLSSTLSLMALLRTVKENLNISSFTIVDTISDKSLTLERYEVNLRLSGANFCHSCTVTIDVDMLLMIHIGFSE
jgi:hypothetical protein